MSRFSAQEFYLQILLALLTPASFFRRSRLKFCWWLWNWPRSSCGWQSGWAVYSGSDVSLVVQQGRRRPSPGKGMEAFGYSLPERPIFLRSAIFLLLEIFSCWKCLFMVAKTVSAVQLDCRVCRHVSVWKKHNNCTWASDSEGGHESHILTHAWEPRDVASANVQTDVPSQEALLPAAASSCALFLFKIECPD